MRADGRSAFTRRKTIVAVSILYVQQLEVVELITGRPGRRGNYHSMNRRYRLDEKKK